MDKRRHVLLRPRVIIYGSLLTGLFVAFIIALANRAPVQIDVLRDRNTLYRELADGTIENVYQIKIVNKDDRSRVVRLTIEGLEGARVETAPAAPQLAPGAVLDVVTRVRVDRAQAPAGGRDVRFRLQNVADESMLAERKARFMGPVG